MRKLTNNLFELRGEITTRQKTYLGILGVTVWFLSWWLISAQAWLPPQVAPGPFAVLGAIPELHFEHALVRNVWYTLQMNLHGTMNAILFSLPIGLLLGLTPFLRGMATPFYVGLRFIPLPVIIGLFMLWFGIGYSMKTWFLTFAIIVYLIPTVIQRVDETPSIYVNTARTLGASKWQIIRNVYIPDVFSRVWDDIVILVAISWTYISIVEVVNKSDGGIGALIYMAQRQSSPEKYYALLLILMLVAYLQTLAFKQFGQWLFPHKRVGR